MSRKSRSLSAIIAAAIAAGAGLVAYTNTQDDPSPIDVPSAIQRVDFARAKSGGVIFTNVDRIPLTPGSCKARVIDAAKGYVLPDPKCTPGAFDPKITESVICTKKTKSNPNAQVFTTKTRRPYSQTTNNWEKKIAVAYGFEIDETYEGDHFLPLGSGGVNDVLNFWPQPNTNPPKYPNSPQRNPKDDIEVAFKPLICTNVVTLREVQRAITSNWVSLHIAWSKDQAAKDERMTHFVREIHRLGK